MNGTERWYIAADNKANTESRECIIRQLLRCYCYYSLNNNNNNNIEQRTRSERVKEKKENKNKT